MKDMIRMSKMMTRRRRRRRRTALRHWCPSDLIFAVFTCYVCCTNPPQQLFLQWQFGSSTQQSSSPWSGRFG